MKSSLLLLAACLLLAGCSAPPPKPQATHDDTLTSIPDIGGFKLAKPIEYGNMSFIPVVSTKDVKQDVDYATLVEAKANGWIEIVELPGGEEVNKLHVRNKGTKPILLLGGELLLGGKQDRIVGHDVVIPPNSEVDVDVYCVEHGRWEGATRSFEPKMQFAPDRVRKAATYDDQSKVWDKVAEYNGAVGGVSTTRSTVDAGLSNAKVQTAIDNGVKQVLAQLKGEKNVVGIIVASDGEVKTLELFGSSKLFDAAREPLLSSFLSEAPLSGSTKSKKVAMTEAAKFVSETLNSQRRLKDTANGANSLRVGSASSDYQGVELASPTYSGKPASKADGLIHGTYKKGD